MEVDLEKQKQRKKVTFLNKRKLILISLSILSFALLGAGLFFWVKEKGEELAKRGVRLPEGAIKKKKREKAPIRKMEKKEREEIKFEVFRDVFKDFYTQKFIAELKKEVEEKLRKEYERKIKSLQNPSISPPSLEEILIKNLKIYAIVCDSECLAYTDRGVFKSGDLYKGVRVIVDENGIRFRRET
ncbi:MAG TPA: hypothetical protein EYH58_00235 [Aquifex aeolicus]|nr:hypothetical protein [Aquifex aeolicus]